MEFRVKVNSDFPFVHVIETDSSEMWLTQLRSEGILKDRACLIKLMFKMFQVMFQCIKEYNQIDEEQTQIILVLRDAMVAFEPAVHVLPETRIGLIGHERKTKTDPPSSEITFKRYENPREFKMVVVVDPMVATGGTLVKVIDELISGGRPTNIIIGCLLITREAASRLKQKVDSVYAFSLEKGLINGAWLAPGLRGIKDLGDLIFKTKLDWEP